jgi:hypothetical protein
LQPDYPEGVIFLAEDRRFQAGNRVGIGRAPFSGIGRRLLSRPGSASQTILPPISKSPTISNSSRPDSVSSKLKTLTKPKLSPNSAKESKKKLINNNNNKSTTNVKPKNDDSPLKRYAPFKVNGVPSLSSNDVCHLKIFGLAKDPFLLELVSYDTVKTLRGVISNLLKSQKIGKPKMVEKKESFKLFTSFPRKLIDDDSMTLGDLNFLPNGVVHVIQSLDLI